MHTNHQILNSATRQSMLDLGALEEARENKRPSHRLPLSALGFRSRPSLSDDDEHDNEGVVD